MKAGLIAAGRGERLRAAGYAMPKPLVPVAGRTLIDHVLDAVAATGIAEIVAVVNEDDADAIAAHCAARPAGTLTLVRRTTSSSMESVFALAPYLGGEPFLLLAVDTVVAPAVLAGFVAAATARTADAVLAVHGFVDDEQPLRVALDVNGWVTAIGEEAAASLLITAGFYLLHPRVFAEIDAARAAGALRGFLRHLLRAGYRIGGIRVAKTIDVDRRADVAAAEAFVRSGYAS
jgi:NDP-sugar pyrophosphorylase family protein